MNEDLAYQFLGRFLIASVFLAVSAIAVSIVLKAFRVQSSRLTAVAWSAVLLQGILLFHLPIQIPWQFQSINTEVADAITEQKIVLANQNVSRLETESAELANTDEFLEAPAPPETLAPDVQESTAWPQALIYVWAIGVCYLLCKRLLAYSELVRHSNFERCDIDEWNAEWHEVLSGSNTKEIPLCVSTDFGPALCTLPGGCRVVVPFKLWQDLSSTQRTTVLRHELAHYRRKDLWRSTLADLIAVMHWFNPLARYAANRLEDAIEWECDDVVQRENPTVSTSYAAALLSAAERTREHSRWATAIDGGRLKHRIGRILSQEKATSSTSMLSLIHI